MDDHELTRRHLVTLPNVGPAIAEMLMRLGIRELPDLRGRDPLDLYHELNAIDGRRYDPCVEDTFAALVDHAGGAPPRPWWEYTPRRKARERAAAA